MEKHPVIFFDGFCGLCNRFVDFVMAVDKKRIHRFAPLQGETALQLLTEAERLDLDSMILYMDGNKLKKARGVLKVLHNLGGLWKVMSLFSFLPEIFLNIFYDFVAKNRYHFFGKREVCRLPTKEERALFLD